MVENAVIRWIMRPVVISLFKFRSASFMIPFSLHLTNRCCCCWLFDDWFLPNEPSLHLVSCLWTPCSIGIFTLFVFYIISETVRDFCRISFVILWPWPLTFDLSVSKFRENDDGLSCVTVGIAESDWHVAEVSGGWIYSTHEAHVWLQPENRSVHTVWPRSWRWTTDQDCSCQLRRRQFHFLFFFITLQRDRSFIQCNLIISHI